MYVLARDRQRERERERERETGGSQRSFVCLCVHARLWACVQTVT